MRAAVNVLLPLRILLKARKVNFHPSCCSVEIFQGIGRERVFCEKKKKQSKNEGYKLSCPCSELYNFPNLVDKIYF